MKKFLIICIFLSAAAQVCCAEQYDDSADAEIRRQYNVQTLPPLPKSAPSKSDMPKTALPEKITDYKFTGKTYTIKSGTKLVLISKNKITNWSSPGSKVSFSLQNPVNTLEGAVIPSGTLFKGTVIDSHPPQMTGNGGLIKLKINEIYFNGVMSAIDTVIEDSGSKKVLRGNIKGKRKYLSNCAKAMTPGRKTFNAMDRAAKAMISYPVINILSIVPLAIGGAVYIVNTPIAPIASVFMKGGAASLSAGSVFHAKVSGSNKIRG